VGLGLVGVLPGKVVESCVDSEATFSPLLTKSFSCLLYPEALTNCEAGLGMRAGFSMVNSV
jgi:hypothetical protein